MIVKTPRTVPNGMNRHSMPAITCTIVGPRNKEQLEGSFRASDLALDDDTMSRLDTISPGPGGPVPEAYAW